MKVAVVTPEYPPDTIGGGGVAVEALVHEYAAKYEVRVFSAADSTRSWVRGRELELVDDIPIHRYPLIPVGKGKPYLRSVMPPNLPAWLALRADLAHWSPDVAHLHGYGCALTDLAAFTLAKRRVPYIFTIHGLPATPSIRNAVIRLSYKAYQRFGVGRAIGGARAVTAVSRAVATAVPRGVPVQVIPNGVAALPRADASRAAQFRQGLAIADHIPVIAAAGRLSTSKGFDVLIKALDQVQVPELVCVIAGSDAGAGRLLVELAARTRSGVSVRLPGPMNRSALADLFSVAAVVVVPSREEPFGLVALEALSSQRRLVASCVGGLAEFLHPGVAELVPPGDTDAVASAITTSLARGPLKPDELKELDRVLAQYSWNAAARQYEELMIAALTA